MVAQYQQQMFQISAGVPTFPSWLESSPSWAASSLTARWWPGSTACPAWWGPRLPRRCSRMEKLSVWTPPRVSCSGLTRLLTKPDSDDGSSSHYVARGEICVEMKYKDLCFPHLFLSVLTYHSNSQWRENKARCVLVGQIPSLSDHSQEKMFLWKRNQKIVL